MTHVLHVTESVGAGVATAVSEYVAATPELTHTVAAASCHDNYSLDSTRPWTAVELPASRWAQYRVLPRLVASTRPDLIHLHSSFAGFYGRLASLPTRAPRIYSPHCFAFERRDLSPATRAAYRRVEQGLSHRTAAFVCPSPHEAALASALSSRARAFVVPHAVTATSGARAAPAPGPARVGTCGRITAQKGVDYFLAFAEAVRGRADVELCWVGDGDPKVRARLERAGVAVTGWLPRPDVATRLARLTAYVHTAAWEVGLPYALLEAAAHGTPVVARELAAYRGESVRTAATPRETAELVTAMLRSSDAWLEASARSRCLAEAHSPARQHDALLAAYRAVLEAHP